MSTLPSKTQLQKHQVQCNYFTLKNNIKLPFAFEINTGKAGKHCVIIGGTHGNEPAGVDSIIKFNQLLESGKIKLESGKITFILGNPEAYLVGKRFIDTNLNRTFLEDLPLGVEGERALEIRQYFDSIGGDFDYLLDIHSVSTGNLKIAVGVKEQIDFMEFIFDPKKDMVGTAIGEGIKRNAKSMGIECGNHQDPNCYKIGLDHITKLLEISGNIEKNSSKNSTQTLKDQSSQNQIIIFKCIQKVVPKVGFKWVDGMIRTGSFVPKNTVYATFENGGELVATQDCYALMPDRNPSPSDNDAGFLCGIELVFPEFF
jgi:predicted deacylase